jgi:hypothetical protein
MVQCEWSALWMTSFKWCVGGVWDNLSVMYSTQLQVRGEIHKNCQNPIF